MTVEIMDLETLRRVTRLAVDEDRTLLHSKEGEHARLRFLRWATPTRLVMAPTVRYAAVRACEIPEPVGKPKKRARIAV